MRWRCRIVFRLNPGFPYADIDWNMWEKVFGFDWDRLDRVTRRKL